MINEKISHPVLIKIDVQGYELEVLRGANNLLKKTDYLLLEVSKNEMYQNQPIEKEVVEYLKNLNFDILKSNNWSKIQIQIFTKEILFFTKNNERI